MRSVIEKSAASPPVSVTCVNIGKETLHSRQIKEFRAASDRKECRTAAGKRDMRKYKKRKHCTAACKRDMRKYKKRERRTAVK